MSDDPQHPTNPARRRLLDGAIALTACGATAAVAVPAARFARPPDGTTGSAASVTLALDALRAAGSRLVEVGGEPVLVVALPDGAVRALSARCTHLGCTVRFARASGEIECPCHGARFGVDGRVVAGPAPAPLAAYEVTEAGGAVVIERRRAWTG